MSTLASKIRRKLDTLVQAYAERLADIPVYAGLPESATLNVARTQFEALAESLETGDTTIFAQAALRQATIYAETPGVVEAMLQAFETLGGALHPLLSTAEEATALYKILSEGRAAASTYVIALLEESESKFRQLVNHSPIGIFRNTPLGQMVEANPAILEMLGYDSIDAINQVGLINLYVTPADRTHLLTLLSQGPVADLESRFYRADGQVITASLTVSLTYDEDGNPKFLEGNFVDITERKRLEQEVQGALERREHQVQVSTQVAQEIAAAPALEELYRRVVTLVKERFDYYHAQIFHYDPASKTVMLVAGYGEAGAKMHAEDHTLPGQGVVGTAIATGQSVLAEDVRQDPHWVPHPRLPETCTELAVPIKWRDEVLGILDVQSNVQGALTEDDQLLLEGLCGQIAIAINATSLLEQANIFRQFADRAGQGFGMTELRGEISYVNPAFVRIFGAAREEEVLGTTVFSYYPKEALPKLEDALTTVMAEGQWTGELPIISKKGELVSTIQYMFLIYDEKGAPCYVANTITDITARKRAEEETRVFRRMIEASGQGLGMATIDGEIAYVNPTLRELLGEAGVGKPFTSYYPDKLQKQLVDEVIPTVLEQGQWTGELALRSVKGRIIPTIENFFLIRDEEGKPLYIADVITDITDRKQAEAEMEERLQELNTLYRGASEEGWHRYRAISELPEGYLFDHDELLPSGDVWTPEVEQATTQNTLVQPSSDTANGGATVAPLSVRGGEIIGALGVYDDPQLPLSLDDLDLIRQVSDQVALALEASRLFEETQFRLAETSLRYRASRTIGNAQTIEDILGGTGELAEFVGMSSVYVRLITERDADGLPRIFDTYVLNLSEGEREISFSGGHPVDEIRALMLSRLDRAIVYTDLQDPECVMPERIKQEFVKQGRRGAILIWLEVRGQVLGLLIFTSTSPLGDFSEDNLRLITTTADQIAVAIDSLQLTKQTEETLEETTILYETNRALVAAPDNQALLEHASQYALDSGVMGSVLLSIDTDEAGDPESMEIAASHDTRGAEFALPVGIQFEVMSFPLAKLWVANPEQLLMFDNIMEDARLDEASRQVYEQSGIRSAILMPLRSSRRWIGLLSFNWDKVCDFDARDERIYRALRDQLTVVLENRLLLQQTEAALAETGALYRTSSALTSASGVDDVLGAIVEYVKSPEFDRCLIAMLDNSEAPRSEWEVEVRAVWDRGGKDDLFLGNRFNATVMPLIEYAALDEPFVVNDFATASHVDEVSRASFAHLGVTSAIMTPLTTVGHLFGWLLIETVGRAHTFSAREVQNFRTIAEQAAVVLYSQRLLDESTRRAEEMGFLFQVTQSATAGAATDLQSALMGVADVIHRFLDAYEVDILVPDAERGALRTMVCTRGIDIGQLVGYKATAVGWVAKHIEPLIIEDATIDQRFSDFAPDIRSVIVMPVAVGRLLSGVIQIQSHNPGAYDEQVLQLLQTMTSSLHAVIQNVRLLEEVQAANEQLGELNRLKSEFLASTSHELRTPLNSIIGFSRVMLKGIDGPLNEMQTQDLTTIHNSGQHLLTLINDILDQSKIEAGQMELSLSFFSLGELIDGVLAVVSVQVNEKPVELIERVADDLPKAWGDEFRTRQVLLNLVNNAIKFTESGNVTIETSQVTRPDGYDMVHVAVTDTGIGIAEVDQHKLFEAFRQVDNTTTRKYEGTGLGLPISKSLIELQGGKIWVDSVVGVGSTFAFSIPVGPLSPGPSAGEAPEEMGEDKESATETSDTITITFDSPEADDSAGETTPAPDLSNVVLVLDDEQGVINMYRRYLTNAGYEVLGTTNPNEVKTLLLDTTPQPFVVLLDVVIPDYDTDGWGVLKQLKEDPQTRDIPVVVCTILDEEARGLTLGAAKYLLKPILEDDLVQAVQQIERGLLGEAEEEEVKEEKEKAATDKPPVIRFDLPDTPAAAAENADARHPPRPKVVLVLDDEQEAINLYRRYLIKKGYEVLGTTDAHAVKDVLLSFDPQPSVVLLDLALPDSDINGWDVLKQLKENPETRNIPVVVCTALDEEERALEMGADKYLSKPVVEKDLVRAIHQIELDLLGE